MKISYKKLWVMLIEREIPKSTLRKDIELSPGTMSNHYIDQAVRLNIYEMFTEALRATRIEMSSSEQKQFVDKYLKTMQMSIADNGDVTLEIRRK